MNLRSIHPAGFFLAGLLLFSAPFIQAQTSSTVPQAQTQPDSSNPATENNVRHILQHLVQDQVAIWTSPFKTKPEDLKWMVPFAGITTGLIMTDRTASHEATRNSHVHAFQTFSDVGLAFAGISAGGFYLLGRYQGDSQLRETGFLGGEAMVDALGVDEVIKYGFQRQRPQLNNGAGRFFESGSMQSMPSAHATLSFAFAAVLSHEYDGWLTKALSYGGATAISLARVGGQKHFPSDIFVGGTLGYLIGQHVYRAHHDQELDGADYGTFVKEPSLVSLNDAGSVYVELDSWIYPAVERLAALGVIRRPFLGLRPWTRTDIAAMLADAESRIDDPAGLGPQASSLYSSLKTEFSPELDLVNGGVNESIRLESLYSRFDPVAGKPLHDSFHFGQTVINDFGRPYQQGINSVSGFTSRAENGHFSFYARGEYQHAPGADALPLSVRNVIAQADLNPVQPAAPVHAADQFRLLDTYAGVTLLGNQVSVGKQSLWWSATEGGSLIFSDNAEPLYMLRINRVTPFEIPVFSRLFGQIRYDNFFGKLAGHNFPPDPYFYGNKISFQSTDNLEFGFTRTAVFAGQGKTPLTIGTFTRSFFSANDVPESDKGTPRDPGARFGAFDFSYKLPFVRNWLTLYSDSFGHDDISPVSAPRRAAVVPGLYLSHFPKFNRLDLRVESGYTDNPVRPNQDGRFFYFEQIYHDAYTNKGNLMGSWIGRQGKGTQVWSNYWLNAYSAIQLAYRNAKISPQFIAGGGTQNDFTGSARLRFRKEFELLASFQYEQWTVPVLASNRTSDFLSSIQLTFWPRDWSKSKPVQ